MKRKNRPVSRPADDGVPDCPVQYPWCALRPVPAAVAGHAAGHGAVACLEFHKTQRNIRTASVTQVRQPIDNTLVQRWRNYERSLGPLFGA